MRVLFVSPYVPSHIRIRPFGWIRALAGLGCRVHLVAVQPPEDAGWTLASVAAYCEACEVFPLSRGRTAVNALHALASRAPLQAAYARSGPAERRIRELLTHDRFDVVHLEHLRSALLVPAPCPAPTVYDAVDCITRLFERAARLAPRMPQRLMARVDLARTRRFEALVPRRFDRVVVSSSGEARKFCELAGADADGRVVAIPNGVDVAACGSPRADDGVTVLFAGKMSYHANEAAALRLAQRVMPEVWRKRPDASLVIAGKDPSAELRRLAEVGGGRVVVTGYVDDLRPWLSCAAVLAAPLVYAAGIQNKVLEAMACGTPVVTTPAACQSLEAVVGRDVMCADSDEAFAEAIVDLLGDPARRVAVGAAGRTYVQEHHQWPRLASRLVAVYAAAQQAFASRS